VIGVPVPLAVDRKDVQVDVVAVMRLQHAAETDPQRWKHSPACMHATTKLSAAAAAAV